MEDSAANTEGADRVTVVIADDHEVVRSGLRTLLEREPDLEVAAEAGDVRSTMAVSGDATSRSGIAGRLGPSGMLRSSTRTSGCRART